MTATRISEVIQGWLGWCPNAPVLRTAPAVLITPGATAHAAQPDGGTGGPGRAGRGLSIAFQSMQMLNRNLQLLAFSLLTGIVLFFLFAAEYGLGVLSMYPYNAIDYPHYLPLTFAISLCTFFCLIVLFAGLLLSIREGEAGKAASFRQGLARAKKYLRMLACWSLILATVCTAVGALLQVAGWSHHVLYPLIDSFPFNYILLPEVYHTGPIGGTFAISIAVTSAVLSSAIVALLTVLTIFTLPGIVLEGRSLPEAFSGSVSLMRKTWGESLACFIVLGAVVFLAGLISLLFSPVYRLARPDMLLSWYPGDAWIGAAVVYMLVVYAFACIIAAVAGIATYNLYLYAKTGNVSDVLNGEQERLVPA